ncbi:hypothetical protein GGX14DRAFT_544526 [Mycena pura]|uniref:Uncharacterized protein n=1 Tax=Mycena pura TaxID=153505 RepID=A0AAD6V866_9AGAR|nr:hypothetical protein GGX14DRAFT_544526 [Mycena pura]
MASAMLAAITGFGGDNTLRHLGYQRRDEMATSAPRNEQPLTSQEHFTMARAYDILVIVANAPQIIKKAKQTRTRASASLAPDETQGARGCAVRRSLPKGRAYPADVFRMDKSQVAEKSDTTKKNVGRSGMHTHKIQWRVKTDVRGTVLCLFRRPDGSGNESRANQCDPARRRAGGGGVIVQAQCRLPDVTVAVAIEHRGEKPPTTIHDSLRAGNGAGEPAIYGQRWRTFIYVMKLSAYHRIKAKRRRRRSSGGMEVKRGVITAVAF